MGQDSDVFASESYTDVTLLKQFLGDEATGDQEAAFMADVIELFADMRFHAEELQKKRDVLIWSERQELPLYEEDIIDVVTKDDADEPPAQLVTFIAQKELPYIERILEHLRKVLRRRRSMVHLSSAQQLDSHCMRWLTRQPGNTPMQKAGPRQQIMAVEREESYNTLENRVLKDFFVRTFDLSKRYIREYAAYEKSKRVQAVRRLCTFAQEALRLPVIAGLPRLVRTPVPNYVLQNDPMYRRMWALYRKIIEHRRFAEMSWPYRHRLFGDIMQMWVNVHLSVNLGFKSVFERLTWISVSPTQGGFFIKPNYRNAYQNKDITVVRDVTQGGCWLMVGDTEAKKREAFLHLVYIPKAYAGELHEISYKTGHYYIVFTGNENIVKGLKATPHLLLLDDFNKIYVDVPGFLKTIFDYLLVK